MSEEIDRAGRAWLPPGTRLNDMYELEEGIAAGGMGEIYRGRNIQTHDPVAIKMIRSDLAETDATMTMFRKEASALNKLYNEAIVRYYGFSVDPTLKRPYMAMEFVAGRSLSEIVKHEPMPYRDVCILGARVATGLQVAHERGIIHRDISPDNIIIPEGDVSEAKIIDFGIARQTKSSEGTIIGDGLAGKYNYMSPEQLGLNDGDVRATSDIYSLGLVLAEAVTARAINMRGNPVELIEKRRKVPDLSHLDPRLAPLVAWMLQPLPQDRPASMAEVAAWLRAAQDAPPEAAAAPDREATVVMPGGLRPSAARPDLSAPPQSRPPSPPPGWTGEPSRAPSQWPGGRSMPPVSAPPHGWPAEPSQRPTTGAEAMRTEVSAAPTGGWAQPSMRPGAAPPVPARSMPPQSMPPHSMPPRSVPPQGRQTGSFPGGPSAHPGAEGDLGTVVARTPMPSMPPPGYGRGAEASLRPATAEARREEAKPAKSSLPLVAAIGAVVVLGGGGVGAWFALSGPSKPAVVVDGKPTGPAKPAEPTKPETAVADGSSRPGGADAVRPGDAAGGKPSFAADVPRVEKRPSVRAADLARYLAGYGGGGCFYLDPIVVADNRVVTEGYGRSIVPFEALDEDFRKAHGFEADIRLRQVTEAQCPAVEFLAKARSVDGNAVRLELAESRVKGGDFVAGVAGATPGAFVAVVMVGDDGSTRVVAPQASADDKPVGFVVPAERGEGGGRPRLVVALASDRRLAELASDRVEPGASFFDRLAKDATQSGVKLAAVARYVVVER